MYKQDHLNKADVWLLPSSAKLAREQLNPRCLLRLGMEAKITSRPDPQSHTCKTKHVPNAGCLTMLSRTSHLHNLSPLRFMPFKIHQCCMSNLVWALLEPLRTCRNIPNHIISNHICFRLKAGLQHQNASLQIQQELGASFPCSPGPSRSALHPTC